MNGQFRHSVQLYLISYYKIPGYSPNFSVDFITVPMRQSRRSLIGAKHSSFGVLYIDFLFFRFVLPYNSWNKND